MTNIHNYKDTRLPGQVFTSFELLQEAQRAAGFPVSEQFPQSTQPTSSGRKFDTGIPGFDMLSESASSNISDLLKGTESPAITQNMNSQWGVGAGVPGTDFLRGRATDLYGQRSADRKQQGLGNLLSMLQGYSGTSVARPETIMGSETASANRASTEGIAGADRAQRQRESEMNAALQAAQMGLTGGTNLLNTYLGFLR